MDRGSRDLERYRELDGIPQVLGDCNPARVQLGLHVARRLSSTNSPHDGLHSVAGSNLLEREPRDVSAIPVRVEVRRSCSGNLDSFKEAHSTATLGSSTAQARELVDGRLIANQRGEPRSQREPVRSGGRSHIDRVDSAVELPEVFEEGNEEGVDVEAAGFRGATKSQNSITKNTEFTYPGKQKETMVEVRLALMWGGRLKILMMKGVMERLLPCSFREINTESHPPLKATSRKSWRMPISR